MAKTELFARWHSGRISPIYSERQSPGRIWFVNSAIGVNAAGYGDSPERPFQQLAYAVIQAVTANGDLILVAPGHTETYAAAASLDINKANLTLLGLGNGLQRPRIIFDGGGVTPGVDINISAANVTIKNFWFLNTEDGATGPIDVNAADFTLDDCIFQDDGTDNTVDWIVLDANANGCTVKNCCNYGTDTTGNDSWITVTGACNHLTVVNCHSHGEFAVANIDFAAAATDSRIHHNLLENDKATPVVCILMQGAATGWLSNNYMMFTDDAALTHIATVGPYSCHQNFGVNNTGEAGLFLVCGGVSA